jgi:F-box-like
MNCIHVRQKRQVLPANSFVPTMSSDDDHSDSEPDAPMVALWRSDPPPRTAPAAARAVLPADPGSPSLAPVPGPVLLAIFASLQTDDRMRCREVCRGWLDLLSDTALWTELDIAGGLSLTLSSSEWLRAASRLSGHALTKFIAYGCMLLEDEDVKTLVAVNGATLRLVQLGTAMGTTLKTNPAVQELFAMNPRLMFGDPRMLRRMIMGWENKSARRLASFVGRAAPEAKLLLDVRLQKCDHAYDILHNFAKPLCVRRLEMQVESRGRLTELSFPLNGVETMDGRYCYRNQKPDDSHRFIGHSSLESLSLNLAWCRTTKAPRWRRWGEEESSDSDGLGDDFPKHGLDQFRMLCASITERDQSLGPPHVRELELSRCRLCPEALDALAGVLHGGFLQKLKIDTSTGEIAMMSVRAAVTMRSKRDSDRLFYTMPEQFIAGLLASKLTNLTLSHCHLFAEPAAGEAVLAAVSKIQTLTTFEWRDHPFIMGKAEDAETAAAAAAAAADKGEGSGDKDEGTEDPEWAAASAMRAGAAIAGLIASNRLTELKVIDMMLGDAPLAVALAPFAAGQASRLRVLEVHHMGAGAASVGKLVSGVQHSRLVSLRCSCCDCDECAQLLDFTRQLEERVRRRAERWERGGATDSEEEEGEDEEDSGSWEEVEEEEVEEGEDEMD